MALPTDFEARFFSRATGLRLAVNPDDILSLTWEFVEAGGTAQIITQLAHSFDDLAWSVQGGDIVEMWALGTGESVPRCRGAVGQYQKTLDKIEKYLLTSYGRMEDMNHVLLDRILLVPGSADLSYFAGQIADDYGARRPGLVFLRDLQPTGVSLERLDQTNSTARASMDSLQAQAGGNVVWGWDIDLATGLDRFYIRPKTSVSGHQFFVGGNVKLVNAPAELQNIVNGLKVQGGPAKYPQLLTNPSFEAVSLPDAATGSLLINGGFEQGTHGSINSNAGDSVGGTTDCLAWNLISGASRNAYDPGTRHNSSAHTGSWYALLDHPGEEAWQECAASPGVGYRASLYAAREKGSFASAGTLIVEGRSASGTVLEAYSLPLAPASTGWTGGQGSTVLASDGLDLSVTFVSASITKARVRIVCTAGSSTQGLLVDDVTFADNSAVGQTGWSTHLQNPTSSANKFNTIDWACRAAAWDGYYGVRLNVTADNSDRPALSPYPGDSTSGQGYHFKPQPQQSIRCGFRVRMSPGLATGSGMAYVEYREWAGDGHQTQYQQTEFTIPNDGAWHFIHQDISAHGDASTATTQLTFAASGYYDVDGATARDVQAGEGSDGTDPLGVLTYLRGTDFEIYVTAEQICTDGSALANAAAASFDAYGRQEAVVSNKDIVDWNADSRQWAVAYFERQAVPLSRPQVQLAHEVMQIVLPGDGTQVRVSGLATPDIQDWCAKATYTWAKAQLAVTLDLSNERPTWAKLLLNINSGGGGGSTSSIAAVAAGGGGNTVTPNAAYFGAMAHSATDATAHDAYTAAPHASQSSQDGWTATTTEVVAARTRTALATSSTTLEGRLDAMEMDIAATMAEAGAALPFYRVKRYAGGISGTTTHLDHTFFDGSNVPSGKTVRAGKMYASEPGGSLIVQTTIPLVLWARLGLHNTGGSSQTATLWIPTIDNGLRVIWGGTDVVNEASGDSPGNDLAATFTLTAGQMAVLDVFFYNANDSNYSDSGNPGILSLYLDALDQAGVVFYDPGP